MATADYETHEHDVIVIGAGGAGLRAAIEAAAQGVSVGLVCKSLLGKAHTVMAEGGVAAALANVDERDGWRVHFADTMRGGQYINNPVPDTMTGPNTYFGQVAVEDVDQNELSTDFGASLHEYRDFVFVGTEVTGDFLRQKYVDAQTNNPAIRDYNVGWVEVGEWLNYTRSFPTGTFNVYGRFANGNIGQFFEATLDKIDAKRIEMLCNATFV